MDDAITDHITKRPKNRDTGCKGQRDGQHTDKDGAKDAGNNLCQQFFAIISEQANQQGRKQGAIVLDGHNGDSEDRHGVFAANHRDKVGKNQARSRCHRVKRSCAQLFRRAVGHEYGHEVKRHVGDHSQKFVGLRIRKCRPNESRQQEEHFKHTTRNEAGDQRGYGSGDKADDFIQHILAAHLPFLLRGSGSLFAGGVIHLGCLCINRDQILPEDDLQLIALEHDAQHGLGFFDLRGIHL